MQLEVGVADEKFHMSRVERLAERNSGRSFQMVDSFDVEA